MNNKTCRVLRFGDEYIVQCYLSDNPLNPTAIWQFEFCTTPSGYAKLETVKQIIGMWFEGKTEDEICAAVEEYL